MTNEEKCICEKYIDLPKKAKRSKRPKLPNGFGSIVKLSGNRRNPYMARPPAPVKGFNEKGYPEYDPPIGYYPEWIDAFIALAEYRKNPYCTSKRKIKFEELYRKMHFEKFKDEYDRKGTKTNSEYCYIAAFKKCAVLRDRQFTDVTATDMQQLLDNKELSHATVEHIVVALKAMAKYAIKYEMVDRNHTEFLTINQVDDDQVGIPFTSEEIALLWKNKHIPFVDTILIYIYSGWRLNELAKMSLSNIDLAELTFKGGLKTKSSRNRTIPIANKISVFVTNRYNEHFESIIYHNGTESICEATYRVEFNEALKTCGIETVHTPHDCRHTFATLLDNADINEVIKKKLLGHASKDMTEHYTHKNIEQLRDAINLI